MKEALAEGCVFMPFVVECCRFHVLHKSAKDQVLQQIASVLSRCELPMMGRI